MCKLPSFAQFLGLLTLILLLPVSASAFAIAGHIQFTAGEVKILNAENIQRAAQKGASVDQGDTIITGASGVLQILMEDGGLIAVRPDTRMHIDAFKYTGKSGTDKSFFSLLKGTFRSITGAIGKANHQAYKVTTPNATIGIRGTDHEPLVILTAKTGEPMQGAPGTYDKVNGGATFIQTDRGITLIGTGQVGYAANAQAAPIMLPSIPAFYNHASTQSGNQSSNTTTHAINNLNDAILTTPTPASALGGISVPKPSINSVPPARNPEHNF